MEEKKEVKNYMLTQEKLVLVLGCSVVIGYILGSRNGYKKAMAEVDDLVKSVADAFDIR